MGFLVKYILVKFIQLRVLAQKGTCPVYAFSFSSFYVMDKRQSAVPLSRLLQRLEKSNDSASLKTLRWLKEN